MAMLERRRQPGGTGNGQVPGEALENVGIQLGPATNLLHSYGIDGYRWLIDDLPVKTW